MQSRNRNSYSIFTHLFDFYSYDATKEEICTKLGRLVNHGNKKERNAKMKIVVVNDMPILCLFALKKIQQGDEVLYDYGQKHYPWENKVLSHIFLRVF